MRERQVGRRRGGRKSRSGERQAAEGPGRAANVPTRKGHRCGRRYVPVGRVVAVLVGLAGLAGACSDPTGPEGAAEPITELPRSLSANELAVIDAGNRFTVDLLRRVHEAAPAETVFLSPLSASMALGMTMNGAAGDTRAQMEDVLGFAGMSAEEINDAYRDLIDLLRGLDPRVELELANAIFHRNGFVMEEPFLDVVRTYFDATVEGLDFADPAAVDYMNDWVRLATGERIDGIIEPPIDPQTTAFLMNAIYFKGDWSVRFPSGDTYTGPFHLADGSTHDVRIMKKEDGVAHRSGSGWQAIEMPYGGGAWVMTVAVPTGSNELDVVLDDLETLLAPDAQWDSLEMVVHLPKFELEWGRTLNDDLRALGMVDPFSPGAADFTPMYRRAREEGLHVEAVEQKTFLRVDEEGTEAAAVTSVEVGVVCACGPPEFRADRPFFLAIRERLSGTVLFAGLIVEVPEE